MRSLQSAVLTLSLFACAAAICGEAPQPSGPPDASGLEEEYQRLDHTTWSKEVEAQKYENTFIWFWDLLRNSGDKSEMLKQLTFDRLTYGKPGETRQYPYGVTVTPWQGDDTQLDHQGWCTLLDQLDAQGYRLLECEFHHPKFELDDKKVAHSTISMVLHVVRYDPKTRIPHRYAVKGDLQVEWTSGRDMYNNIKPGRIDAGNFTVTERFAKPAFAPPIDLDNGQIRKPDSMPKRMANAEPLLVYDLDGDGHSEIIVAGWNFLYWNKGNGKLERDELLPGLKSTILSAVIADVNGDGYPDLVCGMEKDVPVWFEGKPDGRFNPEGHRIEATGKLAGPLCITAGDIDGDGAIDLWITQYKMIYDKGQMPTPYYDANDGNPSFLLHNDGKGNFTDITEKAGLAKKRFRRTYSSSLVDLNGDGFLDLLTVNDFCGIDVYLNDGHGNFKDITESFSETKLFGMSHTFADFNGDGKLDFFVTGMGSTTARRLEFMKLGRPEFPDVDAMRMRMGNGNRMYLATSDPQKFVEPAFKDNITRTGWSWGCTAIDFNNDGYPDIYVANGLQSGMSAKDFCTEYWRHDVYVKSPKPDEKLEGFFTKHLADLTQNRISWNGYEHKVLLMNVEGKEFINVGFPMNVAYEFDARSVVSDDLNLDGRPDLIVTEYSVLGFPAVHVAMNQLETGNNWIGVRLKEEGGGVSPIGAKITVKTPTRTLLTQVVTGDSFRCQHSNTKHFGLGKETVDSIEVKWLNGKTKTLSNPMVNQYIYFKPD